MIGYLEGTLKLKEPPELLVLAHGVGYELEASMQTHYHLPAVGEQVCLFTHLSVREDAHKLYAFTTLAERSLFRTLIKVNGVGPKLGLQILSALTPEEFISRVRHEDIASLTKLPGIGKKTAERLVIEVKDKIDKQFGAFAINSLPQEGGGQPVNDAIGALQTLGYNALEIKSLLKRIDIEGLDTQAIIKEALKELSFTS